MDRTLAQFVGDVRPARGDDPRSAVLYGSTAEGALRPSSDENPILVVARGLRHRRRRWPFAHA